MNNSRRKFIQNSGLSLWAILPNYGHFKNVMPTVEEPLDIHLFSKHLQFLDIKEASLKAAEIGFAGLDLTVRPKGHVLPENVVRDLPLAVEAIEGAGLHCEMITTAIADATVQEDIDVIKTAGSLGVQYYRSNWFAYEKDLSLENSIEHYADKLKALSYLNRDHDIVGCYQNHSGLKIGASVWEVKKVLESVDPEFFGVQYDIRHAVAEGGRSWPNGIKLLKNQIKTIVLKDFKWGKVNGNWQIVNVPLGEGMVDFSNYFRILKKYNLNPPTSLHLEYPLGGAEKGRSSIEVEQKVVFDAMKKDLHMAQKLWREA